MVLPDLESRQGFARLLTKKRVYVPIEWIIAEVAEVAEWG